MLLILFYSREVRIRQRELRDMSNPFNSPKEMFLKLFRLDKYCCQVLINSIGPYMNQPHRQTRIPTHLRILTALHFFDQGSYQIATGHGYSIAQSQPAVSRCIAEVSDVITERLLNTWIKFPSSIEARQAAKRGFAEITASFPHLVGVIDGTQIRIIAPSANHPIHPGQPYYCRKNFYAINTQIIGDSDRKIININARFPGSVNDAAIWMTSGAKRIMQRQYVRNGTADHLLGDSGYPLEPWLMVPFDNPPENSPQKRFNIALSQIRVIIEHINGLLKGRFRCVHGHRALHYNPQRAAKIIYSCAVLHNMCRTYNVPIPNDEDIMLPNAPRPNRQPAPVYEDNWFNEGVRIRNQIVREHFI